MAKGNDDVILRDRMQFTTDANGDRTTLYGRIDLSGYVNTVARQGLAIKEVLFQVRQQEGSSLGNTGIWPPVADAQSGSGSAVHTAALKLYATTRAYENAADVGIASPDVLCIREFTSTTNPHSAVPGDVTSDNYTLTDKWYGPRDLHPAGFTVVSDLLIGVAMDNWTLNPEETLEIDVLLIAEPIKVTTDRMNEILSQAQDL